MFAKTHFVSDTNKDVCKNFVSDPSQRAAFAEVGALMVGYPASGFSCRWLSLVFYFEILFAKLYPQCTVICWTLLFS